MINENLLPTILDCTLRDGGYYNQWKFEADFIKHYLKAICKTEVSVIELGYRDPSNIVFDQIADSLNEALFDIDISNIDLALMIDAKKFLNMHSALKDLFIPANQSKISIIRIAVHFSQVNEIGPLVDSFSELGYRVIINLMQIDNAALEDIVEVINKLNQLSGVEVIYIADSLGSMTPEKVSSLISVFSQNSHSSIGFHAHNNKGLTLVNCLEAIKSGASWIDSTLMGMGRGAGNAKTEQLIPLLFRNYQVDAYENLQKMIIDYVEPLHQKFKWGDNPLYHFAADNNMHPSYVQEIRTAVGANDALGYQLLEKLSAKECLSFDKQVVSDLVTSSQ